MIKDSFCCSNCFNNQYIKEYIEANAEEMIISDDTIKTSLLDDLFENRYSYREIQKGAEDPFDDIDSPMWVIKADLYGDEQTRVFHAWESFKHMIKHYCRFFEPQGFSLREDYLGRMDPYIYDFITDIPRGTVFYRARKTEKSLLPIERIEPYSQMGPPPAVIAKTNRMSPAGIPYLYLASDQETTLKECRIGSEEEAIVSEFISNDELQVLDLSTNRFFASDSIFDPDYDHDSTWMYSFWKSFVKEISEPVSEDKEDHSYEYAATQLVAEYYRIKGYDGICFKSSVGPGKNYVFFLGPDTKYTTNAYPYPFNSEYYFDNLPVLQEFTDVFKIDAISQVDGKMNVIRSRKI